MPGKGSRAAIPIRARPGVQPGDAVDLLHRRNAFQRSASDGGNRGAGGRTDTDRAHDARHCRGAAGRADCGAGSAGHHSRSHDAAADHSVGPQAEAASLTHAAGDSLCRLHRRRGVGRLVSGQPTERRCQRGRVSSADLPPRRGPRRALRTRRRHGRLQRGMGRSAHRNLRGQPPDS